MGDTDEEKAWVLQNELPLRSKPQQAGDIDSTMSKLDGRNLIFGVRKVIGQGEAFV